MPLDREEVRQWILEQQGLQGRKLNPDQTTGVNNALGMLMSNQGLLSRIGPEAAKQYAQGIGSPMGEVRREAQGLMGQLREAQMNRNAPVDTTMTAYQKAQVANWQAEAVRAQEMMELQRRQMQLRERELSISSEFRQKNFEQAAERLGLQIRPTPQQGAGLAQAEFGQDVLDTIIGTAKPQYFGFVSENVGEAAMEFKERFGSDVEFSTFWNLLDNARIEINSGRLAGVLTDQDMKLLNQTWPTRKTDPQVAMRFLGNLRTLMQDKAEVQRQGIGFSGRQLPGQPLQPVYPQVQRPSLDELAQ